MDIKDFVLKSQIEAKPNPGLKKKKWCCGIIFLISVILIALEIALFEKYITFWKEYQILAYSTIIIFGLTAVSCVSIFFNLMERPAVLHCFPDIKLPIIEQGSTGFSVKNLKNETETFPLYTKHGFEENIQKAYIEISGTLEYPVYVLVMPFPPI